MPKIYILLASFNRSKKTIDCLQSIFECSINNYEFIVVLYDDKSNDDTVNLVKAKFPATVVLNGTGDQYWCRSMCLAYEHVRKDLHDCDFLLCLNDDVSLVPGAIKDLLSQFSAISVNNEAVIVGCCSDTKGNITYGGLKRTGKIKFELVKLPCEIADTMNFNVVLIPCDVVMKYGFLNPVFEHSMGDIEYGLRLSGSGVKIYSSDCVVAHCDSNFMESQFENKNIVQRLRICLSKKYFPVNSWLFFTKTIAGPLWPIYFIYPYMKFTVFYRINEH